MADTKKIFEQQGGVNLLKQFQRSGTLHTAAGEFLLLGKSRTALEILRLATQLKAKQHIEKKFGKDLKNFCDHYHDNSPHESSNKVWICWFQGLDSAPFVVQECYKSLIRNMPDREVILITKKNMLEYVEFPDYILEKWEIGEITNTHMADLLRLELLIKYGGMWVDATVYCSGSNIPDYFFTSDLFMFQCLKPGRDGHSHVTSSWLISAKTNNKVLEAVRFLCYQYWKKYNSLIDYFLFHDFMAMSLDCFEEERAAIVPRDNATPHILQLRLFDKYDEGIWQSLKEQTPFHKLTYKYDPDKEKLSDTYFYELFISSKY